MPNGVDTRNEFEAATRVMESGLLRVLADESSGAEGDRATNAMSEAAPEIEIVVAEPVKEEVATQTSPQLPAATVPVLPPVVTASPASIVATDPPHRGSRLFIVAGLIAAIVLAFDASVFLFHQRRAALPRTAPATPAPLPRYMVLPLGSPAPAVETAEAEKAAPTPSPADTPVVAEAMPDTTQPPGRTHRHSHHRHVSH